MEFCPLFSGSSGNATYIGDGSCGVLIDAGMSMTAVCTALRTNGIDPASIRGILVTHEHSDHVCGIGPLSRKFDIPVYANLSTWEAMTSRLGNVAGKNGRVFTTGQDFYINDLGITPFRTPHDAAESVGYRIECGGKVFAYMTDIGHVSTSMMSMARGADLVMLESNHDVDMLIKGSYPQHLKKRILGTRGHLSNKDAAAAVIAMAGMGVRRVMLGHLSEHNNTEELARDTTLTALLQAGIKPFEDIHIGIARRRTPGRLAVL